MRDAAGDSGEFYTPRPLVRMIVTAHRSAAREVVLDPAAGTGGFLVEAYEHLRPLCDDGPGLRAPAARHAPWYRGKAAPLSPL